MGLRERFHNFCYRERRRWSRLWDNLRLTVAVFARDGRTDNNDYDNRGVVGRERTTSNGPSADSTSLGVGYTPDTTYPVSWIVRPMSGWFPMEDEGREPVCRNTWSAGYTVSDIVDGDGWPYQSVRRADGVIAAVWEPDSEIVRVS